MNPKLQQKLEYTLIGCAFSLGNVALIGTRFNIFGIGLGLVACYFYVQAIRIRK